MVEGDRMRRGATGTAERRGLNRTTHRDLRPRHARKGRPGTWDGVSTLRRETGTAGASDSEPGRASRGRSAQ